MGLFADDIAARYRKDTGKPAPKAGADDTAPADGEGSNGRMLAAALKKGDGVAIEAAVRAICDAE